MAKTFDCPYTEDIFDKAEMHKTIEGYFEAIMASDPSDREGSKARIGAFLAEGYVSREADWPQIRIREGWLNFLVSGYPQYKFTIWYKEPSGYMIIDSRRGMAIAHVRQEIYNRETGECVRSNMNNIHFRVIKTPEGLKIDREAVSRIPALFQVDSLKTGEDISMFMVQPVTDPLT